MRAALPTRPLVRALVVLALTVRGPPTPGGPLPSHAQDARTLHRIGFVGFQSPGLESRMIAYFQERRGELGYVEGRNVSGQASTTVGGRSTSAGVSASRGRRPRNRMNGITAAKIHTRRQKLSMNDSASASRCTIS
jgi:hypothetical protein